MPANPSSPGVRSNPATNSAVRATGGNSSAAGAAGPKIPGAPPPDTSIAGARAKGLVWVDMNTKTYHTPGDSEYGTTKNGKFMTADDAKAAGARMAEARTTN